LLYKSPIYAAIGVAEVWRYDGKQLTIFCFEEKPCRTQEESRARPGLTRAVISQFIAESKILDRLDWAQRIREWAQQRRA